MSHTSTKCPALQYMDYLLQTFMENDPDFLHLELDKQIRAWKRLTAKSRARQRAARQYQARLHTFGKWTAIVAISAAVASFLLLLVCLA